MYNYYFQQLSSNNKNIYNVILNNILLQHRVFSIHKVDSYNLKIIYNYVILDNPKLFYVDGLNTFCLFPFSRLFLKPDYLYNKNEVIKFNKNINQVTDKIINFTSQFDTYNKIKILHDLFCKKLIYFNDAKYTHNIIGVFIFKKAVCEGIAKGCKLLLDKLSVPNYIVYGKGRGNDGKLVSHMWNKVILNSHVLNLDITMDLCNSVNENINYSNFLVTDKSIRSTHVEGYIGF